MRRVAAGVAFAAVAVAYAWPMQVTGDNQNAHYALVKAISRGVPYIDETLRETGDLQSHDVVRAEGHLYAVKAPGLAFAAQPAYALARVLGMRTTGDPMRVLWLLTLLTSALATAVLFLLVRDVAEWIEPNFGTATAVTVGLGALTLPFATLFFSHALGTALVFAAFWALWRERAGGVRGRFVAAGGALAGLAVTVEHPTMWVVPILAAYAAARPSGVRRLAVFAGGTLAGAVPLFAFNAWAFGNPLRTPYDYYWRVQQNFDRFALPSWHEFSKLAFSSLGLAVLAPVLVAGAVGIALLFRRGRRAEAIVCAAAPLALVVYFSGSNAFGGLGPPRYLTPIMPFALVAFAAAARRFPLASGALAAISIFQAVVHTATGPLAAYDGDWLERLRAREFVATAASFLGVTGWYAIAPLLLAAVAAVAAAVAATPRVRFRVADAALALGAAAAWGLVTAASSFEVGDPPSDAYVVAVVGAVAALVAACMAATVLHRRQPVPHKT